MRYELNEVIAFLPDGQRVSGFLGNYGELHQVERVDLDNQPLPAEQNFAEGVDSTVFDLYAPFLTPPAKPTQDGSYAMDDIDKMEAMIKLVRVEEAEPTDTFESLSASERCPWQGYLYDCPEQWTLELHLALEYGDVPEPTGNVTANDLIDDDGPTLH